MSRLLSVIPFAAALSLLACQDGGPVAEGAAAPPDGLVGDASATGLAAPANAAAAEAGDRSALPPSSAGMAWSAAGDRRSVRFGPPQSAAQLSIACASRGLIVTRHHPAPVNGSATLSFTGGGTASSLPVKAVSGGFGPGEAAWQGRAEGDMARAILRPFARSGVVEITLGGAPSLVTPADPAMHRLLVGCLAG